MSDPVVRFVVTPVDYGIDGLAPRTIYGDDIGPFDTRPEAEMELHRLQNEATEQRNFYATWEVREVTRQVHRWE